MVEEMARAFWFTLTYDEIPPDGAWGEFTNGTWRGMVGLVYRRERSFTINNFGINRERFGAVDFSFLYATDGYSFTLRTPPPLPRWLSLIYPFQWTVWTALLATILLMAPLFAIVVGREIPYHQRSTATLTNTSKKLKKIGRCIMKGTFPACLKHIVYNHSIISTMIYECETRKLAEAMQKMLSNVQKATERTMWLAALVISTSYMGNLIAFITVPAQAQKLRTLSQLAESDHGIHMLEYGDYVPGALRTSKDPILKALGDKIEMVYSYDDGIDGMLRNTHALLEGSMYLRYLLTDRKIKNIYYLEEELFSNYIGWLFPKGTAWKYKMDKALHSFTEMGLVSHWYQETMDDFRRSKGLQGRGDEGHDQRMRTLNMQDLQGHFMALGIGFLVSLGVFLLEKVLHQCT
ncbi:ionotropic receptor 21a-like [Oratosquilla oratoria]|uniref:ionotropic receptor 21a-like n=1 Tax=Oratosquilla oratoria TaxID=337810 RepID=UPI003F75EAFC